MRTTIRLTVTRPDGVPFDKALTVDLTDMHSARAEDRKLLEFAFEKLSEEFDGFLHTQFPEYRPSPIEEIEKALYLAKQNGGNK